MCSSDLSTVSVLLHPQRLERDRVVGFAQRADRAGLGGLWSVEAGFDSIGMAHEMLTASERIVVGSAIAARWKRHPMQMAEAAATVDHLYPGRLAIGVGSAGWMDDPRQAWMQPLDRPVGRMREYVEVMRAAFNGGVVDYVGEFYDVHDQLDLAPGSHMPIYVAGGGPQLCRLSARMADGVFIEARLASPFAELVAETRATLEAAGREPDVFPVHQMALVSVADKRADARATLRRNLIDVGFGDPGDQRALADAGYKDTVEALVAHLAAGDVSSASSALPDEVVDLVALAFETTDSDGYVRSRLRELIRPGATRLVLYPYSTDGQWLGEYERVFALLESLSR